MSCQSCNNSLSRTCRVNWVKPDGSSVTFAAIHKIADEQSQFRPASAFNSDVMWNSVSVASGVERGPAGCARLELLHPHLPSDSSKCGTLFLHT